MVELANLWYELLDRRDCCLGGRDAAREPNQVGKGLTAPNILHTGLGCIIVCLMTGQNNHLLYSRTSIARILSLCTSCQRGLGLIHSPHSAAPQQQACRFRVDVTIAIYCWTKTWKSYITLLGCELHTSYVQDHTKGWVGKALCRADSIPFADTCVWTIPSFNQPFPCSHRQG